MIILYVVESVGQNVISMVISIREWRLVNERRWMDGREWMYGWVDGWMGGWVMFFVFGFGVDCLGKLRVEGPGFRV